MYLGSKPYIDPRASTAHQARIDRLDLGDVNYGNAEEVDRARRAIKHLGVWDAIANLACAGQKVEALSAMEDLVLLDKAAAWHRKYPHAALDKRLSKLDRVELQDRLLDVLLPEGRRVILAHHLDTPEGIRFTPEAGTGLESLLSVTLPHQQAKALLDQVTEYTEDGQVSVSRRFSDVGEAWAANRVAH